MCRCRGDLHVVCFKFWLKGMLDAYLRDIFVNGATFDCFGSWPSHGLIFSLAGRGPIAAKFCAFII